ncbi:glycosyltransferase [candidate division GN15 bacterium]|nr:glycosyltransferase [candidate division GN15 bacterium]
MLKADWRSRSEVARLQQRGRAAGEGEYEADKVSSIAVIIRTYNEESVLGRTLDMVGRQKESDFTCIVVDSESTDQTVAIAAEFPGTHIETIPKATFSYGKSLNLGCRTAQQSGAHYFVFLSAHAVPVDNEWLTRIVEPMRRDDRVAGVYGRQVPMPEHMENPVVRALAAGAYRHCYPEVSHVTDEKHFFSNANAAIRNTRWQEVWFDEDLPFCEDLLWAKTMIGKGFRIGYQHEAKVYHSHAESYLEYFRRSCLEIEGALQVDPERYTRFGLQAFLRRTTLELRHYGSDVKNTRSVFGRHFDRFRLNVVRAWALHRVNRRAGW